MKLTKQDIKWYNEGQDNQEKHIRAFLNYFVYLYGCYIENEINIYQFITDPQYGFLDLFNKPDSPWQKGFWKWMEEMGYAVEDEYNKSQGFFAWFL